MMKNLLILTIILGTLVLSGCGDGVTGNSIKLTSPLKICKMVDVPYQATEEYQVPLKYEYSGMQTTTLHGFDVWAVGEVTIKNVDSETGLFTVSQTFTTLNRQTQTKSSSHYVMSGESVIFHEEYDISLGEDFKMTYTVQPPTKTLTRTVTKYRQEEQCE